MTISLISGCCPKLLLSPTDFNYLVPSKPYDDTERQLIIYGEEKHLITLQQHIQHAQQWSNEENQIQREQQRQQMSNEQPPAEGFDIRARASSLLGLITGTSSPTSSPMQKPVTAAAKPLTCIVYTASNSSILPPNVLVHLLSHTPPRFHLRVWRCIYSLTRDGASFGRLFSNLQDIHGSVVIIHTKCGRTFGGFNSESWARNRNEHTQDIVYGNGEGFVFECKEDESEEPQQFPTTVLSQPSNSTVVASSATTLTPTSAASASPASNILSRSTSDVISSPSLPTSPSAISPLSKAISPSVAASITPLHPVTSATHLRFYHWSHLNDHFMFTDFDDEKAYFGMVK